MFFVNRSDDDCCCFGRGVVFVVGGFGFFEAIVFLVVMVVDVDTVGGRDGRLVQYSLGCP